MADQEPSGGKVVSIPGFGDVLIPDELSPTAKQRFEAEARDRYKKTPADQKPDGGSPVSWLDTAVDWLPQIGGAIGGTLGASTGVATFGLSGVPGAVTGGAVGGMVGEAAKQTINRLRGQEAPETVMDAGAQVLKQGAVQGLTELVPAAIAKGASAVATPLMRSALGHTDAVLSRAPDVAKTALKAGATVTRAGIHKLDDILATKLGLADKVALEATREAVSDAWKKLSTEQAKTLFGATAGNPAFRSAMANGLYHSAAYFGRITPQAIRVALGLVDATKE